jgi:hypothetical protein
MFVRKKNNPSGVVSIQIIDKSHGKYKVIKTIGSGKEPDEVTRLYIQGKKWIANNGTPNMFTIHEKLRPMFHFTPKRIEAHVCICFVAYKVYKELERILKVSDIKLSVDKVLNIAKTITTLKINLPVSGETLTRQMLITAKHKSIGQLFDSEFWKNF